MFSDEEINKHFGKEFFYRNELNELNLIPQGKILLALTVSFMCLILYFFSSILFSLFSVTYKNLPKKEKMFWNLAIVRGVYGLIGSLASIYERYFDSELQIDVSKSKTVNSYILVHSHLGFFIFEWSAQIFFDIYFKVFSKALHGHHLVSLIGYFLASYQDVGHYLPCSGFILEFSTPFSCICFCLIKSKMAETLLWKVNQMALIHVFHLRSVFEFTFLYEIYKDWNKFRHLSFIWNFNLISGLVLIGFFLTPYWTYRKTEQFFSKADWNDQNKKKQK